MTTVEHAALRGVRPPCRAAVGCLPPAREAHTCGPRPAGEDSPPPGLRLCPGCWQPLPLSEPYAERAFARRRDGPLFGTGPPQGTPFPGDRDHALRGLVACGHALTIALAVPDLGLPADGLQRGRALGPA
jgi:hypothetical protein